MRNNDTVKKVIKWGEGDHPLNKNMADRLIDRAQKFIDEWRTLKGTEILVDAGNLTPRVAKVIDVSETGKILLYYYPQVEWEDLDFTNIVVPLVPEVGDYMNQEKPEVHKEAPDEVPGMYVESVEFFEEPNILVEVKELV